MDAPRIITNNVPRDIVYGYELTEVERQEFDWYLNNDELECRHFARYKGEVYDLGDFVTTADGPWTTLPATSVLRQWDGYACDSFFSGVVVRYTPDHEHVVMGTYLA